MKVVYLAGPMTGIENYNFPAFNEVAKKYEALGWLVLNPANHLSGNLHARYDQYMRASFHDVLQADAVALLDGWQDSPGATKEACMAAALDLPIFLADGWPLPLDEYNRLRSMKFSDLP